MVHCKMPACVNFSLACLIHWGREGPDTQLWRTGGLDLDGVKVAGPCLRLGSGQGESPARHGLERIPFPENYSES